MKNLKSVLACLVLLVLFTACTSNEDFEKEINKYDEAEIISALLSPPVAAKTGVKINGVARMILNTDQLDAEILDAIEAGALDNTTELILTIEQALMIFGYPDLASIPNTIVADPRIPEMMCYEVWICGGGGPCTRGVGYIVL